MFFVGLADKYGIPPSRLLNEWGSRDITLLQAFFRIQNRESRMQQRRIMEKQAAKPRPRELSPAEILKGLDADLKT